MALFKKEDGEEEGDGAVATVATDATDSSGGGGGDAEIDTKTSGTATGAATGAATATATFPPIIQHDMLYEASIKEHFWPSSLATRTKVSYVLGRRTPDSINVPCPIPTNV